MAPTRSGSLTRPTMPPYAPPAKANGTRVRQADGYLRARQSALRGHGSAIAAHLKISWHTLEKELADEARCPVRRVADRLRALSAIGATTDRLRLYVLEILDVVHGDAPTAAAALDVLIESEACAAADKSVIGSRALLRQMPAESKKAWADHLRREAAAAIALADALDAPA